MPASTAIKFRPERFDYTSELPATYNPGNRFYGKDVAEFLASELTKRGVSAAVLDEDWGWSIFGKKDTTPEFEVAVYHLAEHGQGHTPGIGEWGFWVRQYERKKFLGLMPRRLSVEVSPSSSHLRPDMPAGILARLLVASRLRMRPRSEFGVTSQPPITLPRQ